MNIVIPEKLQAQVEKEILDDAVAAAKGKLLKSIKRSAYAFRIDCGGCNACEIEIFASITPLFDAERFGIKVVPTPRHADILIYTGAITRSMRMPALRSYEAAPDPKIIVSYGACGISGGIFHDNYCVWGGTEQLFPVDVFIPGCPPSPAQTIYGFAIALGLLEQKIKPTHFVEGEENGDGSDDTDHRLVDGETRVERVQGGIARSGSTQSKVQIPFAEIPYNLRVKLECHARLMSGYRQGRQLSHQFMQAMLDESLGTDAYDRINRLLAAQTDPRRVEVFQALKGVLDELVVGRVS